MAMLMATINDLDKLAEWQIDAGEQGYILVITIWMDRYHNQDKDNLWLPNMATVHNCLSDELTPSA